MDFYNAWGRKIVRAKERKRHRKGIQNRFVNLRRKKNCRGDSKGRIAGCQFNCKGEKEEGGIGRGKRRGSVRRHLGSIVGKNNPVEWEASNASFLLCP